MEKTKKRRGDRRDASLVRDLDSIHAFMPFLLPGRTNNEAVLNETFDLGAVLDYIKRKNSENPGYKYTIFQVVCAAIAKTIYLRPKMNRFLAGHRTYDRHDLSFSFIVKKQFSDDAKEAVAILKIDKDSDVPPITQFHDKLRDIVEDVRIKDKQDGATDIMDVFKKMPRFLVRFIVRILFLLDYYGKLPSFIADADPYNCSVFVTNLGSIKMHADYHHLVDWGTNSFFVVISEKYRSPRFNEDGTFELRDVLDIGVTIDERIADGVYFAGTIHLIRRLLAEPELLELPLSAPVELEFKAPALKQSAAGAK